MNKLHFHTPCNREIVGSGNSRTRKSHRESSRPNFSALQRRWGWVARQLWSGAVGGMYHQKKTHVSCFMFGAGRNPENYHGLSSFCHKILRITMACPRFFGKIPGKKHVKNFSGASRRKNTQKLFRRFAPKRIRETKFPLSPKVP